MTLSEITAIRNFFSQEEWDIIYDALFEFESEDENAKDVMNKISSLFQK